MRRFGLGVFSPRLTEWGFCCVVKKGRATVPILAPPLPLVAADKFSFRQDVPLHRLFQVRFCSRGL